MTVKADDSTGVDWNDATANERERVGIDERQFRDVNFPSAEYRRESQRTGEMQSPQQLGGIN